MELSYCYIIEKQQKLYVNHGTYDSIIDFIRQVTVLFTSKVICIHYLPKVHFNLNFIWGHGRAMSQFPLAACLLCTPSLQSCFFLSSLFDHGISPVPSNLMSTNTHTSLIQLRLSLLVPLVVLLKATFRYKIFFNGVFIIIF